MVVLLTAVLALQVSVNVTKGDSAAADSARRQRGVSVTINAGASDVKNRKRRAPKREPITTEHLRTAFRDGSAREMLETARVARLQQDSTLLAYDAMGYRRISAGLGFKRIGRDRLVFRHESAARVRWQRGSNVWIDVVGARNTVPIAPPTGEGRREMEEELQGELSDMATPIPYFPGREALWVGSGISKVEVDEGEIVHPLATGAEAYYQYQSGDSATFELPDGTRIRIRELRVRARRPQWNLIVGSFWFDLASAQLVRAVYRQSEPLDIVMLAEQDKESGDDGIPRWLRPMTANIESITVEYGLIRGEEGGHWWLPRIQAAEGHARVSFMRVPFALEESFKYTSVNGRDSLPVVPEVLVAALPDTTDSLAVADSVGDSADSVNTDSAATRSKASRQYDDGDATLHYETRYDGAVKVAVRVPKDADMLAHSPELPPSPFDAGEELFGEKERDDLRKDLEGLYPGFAPQRPVLHYGLERGLVRYNRIEGLSAGAAVEQVLGQGLTAEAMLRVGVADWQPNGELSLRRSRGQRNLQLGIFRRLGVANDWSGGDPLGLGGSLSALLFGRDDGFYYRAWGAELSGTLGSGGGVTWRLFGERHSDAKVETQFSLAKAINNVRFIDNINATDGSIVGAATRGLGSWGLNPHGWRLLADARAEGGSGSFDFGRASLELTLSHGLGRYLDAAITGGAGTSTGDVPAQRLWYLGGSQSIRGHTPGVATGDAYWLGRAELGSSFVAARPTIFYDLGWAVDRDDWSRPGRPVTGAGVGASLLDGLIRFDIAKGIRPSRSVRADLYLEARF
ncbi:MAG: hypothetical protein ABR543_11165 [Gemmatimonadaceae bacterium]